MKLLRVSVFLLLFSNAAFIYMNHQSTALLNRNTEMLKTVNKQLGSDIETFTRYKEQFQRDEEQFKMDKITLDSCLNSFDTSGRMSVTITNGIEPPSNVINIEPITK